jgi:hypothetical protein
MMVLKGLTAGVGFESSTTRLAAHPLHTAITKNITSAAKTRVELIRMASCARACSVYILKS